MRYQCWVGWAVLAAPFLTACGDPLAAPELIDATRVIGARLEVEGATDRAWPAPGESARARWLVAHPGAPRPVAWAFAVCPAVPVAYGSPTCASAPFATAALPVASLDEPRVDFAVPPSAELDGVEQLVALGVVCTAGAPRLADTLEASGCTGGEDATARVAVTFGLAGEATNHNPALATAPFTLDGVAWPPPDDPAAATCADAPDAPRVAPGARYAVAFELSAADRETLAVEYDFAEAREALQISHYTTAGDLDRPYTVLEGDAPNRVESTFTAPGSVDEAGELVRLYFVARDLRGGADWAVRTLCVTP